MSLPVNPGRIHQALTSYQLAQSLKGAIHLDLFTHIAAGHDTVPSLSKACHASEKGIRVLCDYLTVHEFLTKSGDRYGLTPDTAPLLDRTSPRYMGQVADFFVHPTMVAKYDDVAELVRNGGARAHTLSPNEPMWVEFARNMAPMFDIVADIAAGVLASRGPFTKILDVAAGHGLFGAHAALANPTAQVTFQDWENVLTVARENAALRGVIDRSSFVAGSFFDVALGSGYDLILLPNFLHHFDEPTIVALLKKARAALQTGGQVAVIEFVPNEDRVSPKDGALFAMRMLGTTPAGDAYTLRQLETMLRLAGFDSIEAHSLAPAHQQLILAR
jgi:2-polyprenyl-3-methyl-5-hydroxy-6-metoxy-1,4-benzoquinol methylase